MSEPQDPYRVLGVSKTDPDDVVRKAYRKLARQYHPDVNPGDKAAEEKFKEVSGAYDILSDAKKRKLYDEFGAIGLREGFDAQRARAYARSPFGGGRAPGGAGGAGGPGGPGPDFDLGDLFGDLFSGGGGGGGGRRRGPQRGRDVAVRVEVGFTEALRGTEVTLQLPGGGPATPCGACSGSGKIGGPHGNPCGACGGRGSTGGGSFTVRIPKGADDGSRLRVSGRGESGPGGAGDLIIETRVKPHPYFSRTGLDLLLRLPISLEEAYCGATVAVPTPSGEVSLKVPPCSQPATRLRLRERGVARGNQCGDMLVELDVRLPDRADAAAQEAIKQTTAAYSGPLRENLRL